jgi:threonylcarbamoyladenosine tRNA methylthiotransferase MtaB
VTRFYIENFGCRATQADGATIERQFLDRGLERAREANNAEIVVLNTCTVTASADKDARASIRRVKRSNPNCRILVTGCYAQRAPDEIAVLPGVTWVVGNSHKHALAAIATSGSTASLASKSAPPQSSMSLASPSLLSSLSSPLPPPSLSSRGSFVSVDTLSRTRDAEVHVGDIFAHTELLAAPVFEAANERTRPNLKVQDGCDNRCSFCVIPSVRGKSRSMPMERVIAEVQALVSAGYREVVISGINLGRWGRDLPGSTSSFSSSPSRAIASLRFVDLVRAILGQTSLEKLRISSVEPMDWSDELIDLVAGSERIAKHAHVPMQSGSDAMLRRMHRKYRPWHYREKIVKIRSAMPSAAIGADVMVGFPGETDSEFAQTRQMIEQLPLTYLHVFTYSPRPGTPAAIDPKQIPVALARERNGVLRELAAQKKASFMRSLVGTKVRAITLQAANSNFTEALTDNYLKSKIAGRHASNLWLDLQIESAQGEFLVGRSAPAA